MYRKSLNFSTMFTYKHINILLAVLACLHKIQQYQQRTIAIQVGHSIISTGRRWISSLRSSWRISYSNAIQNLFKSRKKVWEKVIGNQIVIENNLPGTRASLSRKNESKRKQTKINKTINKNTYMNCFKRKALRFCCWFLFVFLWDARRIRSG